MCCNNSEWVQASILNSEYRIRSCSTFTGGIDGCLLVEPPALVLVFIYQARLNAIYTAELSRRILGILLGTK